MDWGGYQEVYAAWSKDGQELTKSSSGGIAFELSKAVINRQGCVYGTVYGKDMLPRFRRADNLKDIKDMRGSKYVQCDTKDTYASVKADVENGKLVLFVGMPCQVGALRRYLKRDYDNLYAVDILCSGVTSPLLFQAYCGRLSKKIGGKITDYDFRNKDKHGWSVNTKIIYEKNGKIGNKYISGGFEKYTLAYVQKSIYRKSCYRCKFASARRAGDLTIGDFWGINKWHEELDVNRGISCVLLNNEKGKRLFRIIEGAVESIPESLEHLRSTNKPLTEPCKCPPYREKIFREFAMDGTAEYKAKELGKAHTIIDILTRAYLLISPSMQRRLQKTFLYRIYKGCVK